MGSKIIFCERKELIQSKQVTRWIDQWRDEVTAIIHGGEIFVVSSVCPHFGGELKFEKKRSLFRCNWHHWEFNLIDGKCLTFPIAACLWRYDFEIENDKLVVMQA